MADDLLDSMSLGGSDEEADYTVQEQTRMQNRGDIDAMLEEMELLSSQASHEKTRQRGSSLDLDELANEMLQETAQVPPKKLPATEAAKTQKERRGRSNVPTAVTSRPAPHQPQVDFGSLMSQMMPMMSQMMGGGQSLSGFATSRSASGPREATHSNWRSLLSVLPTESRRIWEKVIEDDIRDQRKILNRPLSRAYKSKPREGKSVAELLKTASKTPIDPEAILQENLKNSARSLNFDQQSIGNGALQSSGLSRLYARQTLLDIRSRLNYDADFQDLQSRLPVLMSIKS